jgi:hypothetical protein
MFVTAVCGFPEMAVASDQWLEISDQWPVLEGTFGWLFCFFGGLGGNQDGKSGMRGRSLAVSAWGVMGPGLGSVGEVGQMRDVNYLDSS